MGKKLSGRSNQPDASGAKTGSPQNALEALKPHEAERLQAFRKRSKEYDRRQPPRLKAGKESGRLEIDGDEVLHLVAKLEATGTVNIDLAEHFADQVMRALPDWTREKAEDHNAMMAMLNGIRPQNELEGMIGVQIVASHNLAMEFMRRAMLKDQSPEAVDSNVNRATKLLRTFAGQLEALNRLRGKGQQRVTVEHVTVQQGGQAIVGNVAPGGAIARKT